MYLILNKLAQFPFSSFAIRGAAIVMLFVPIAVDVIVLAAWIIVGLIEQKWLPIPGWLPLAALVLTFVQILISSFMIGVASQLDAKRDGVSEQSKKTYGMEPTLGDKVSETIDEGWTFSLRACAKCAAVGALLVGILVGIFFNDIIFICVLHKALELDRDGEHKLSQLWFKKAVHTAGKDRLSVSHFFLAGSYLADHDDVDAENELKDSLQTIVPGSSGEETMRALIALERSKVMYAQRNYDQAEVFAKEASDIISRNPQSSGVEFRLFGPYKGNLLRGADTIMVSLALQDIYLKKGDYTKALYAYLNVLRAMGAQFYVSEDEELEQIFIMLKHQEDNVDFLNESSQDFLKNCFDASKNFAQSKIQSLKAPGSKTFEEQYAAFKKARKNKTKSKQ